MSKKNEQKIKFEADVTGFKKNIKEAEKSITSLNQILKLNKAQLAGNGNSTELLSQRLDTLKQKHKEQAIAIENTEKAYQKAIELNMPKQAEQLSKKLTDLKAKQQLTANEIDKINEKLEIQKNKFITNGEKIEKFGDNMTKLGDKINNAGNKLSVLSTGVASLGVASVKTYMSFEDSMRKVAATMGITAKEIENGSESYKILEEAAQNCGKTTKYSASEAADALNYLALAGYDAKKSAEVLPKVLNLAAAGDLELATASDMVTDAMAALGMETKDLDKYINEMARTSQKSNTSVGQLGEATLTCAGTVKLANMSLETMNAELGILANNGIKGAEGGTHLRNIILSLTSPTDTAAKALKNLGINVTDSSGNIRDLNDIMSDFNKKLDGLSDEKKTNIISTIFNKTDISAVNALIKGSGDEFSNLKKEITNCDNAAQDMADVMSSSVKGQITKLKSELESNAITVGKKLIPTLKKAVDKVSDLSESFSNLTDEQVESIVKAGAVVVALGPVTKIVGNLTTTLGKGTKALGTITKAIGFMGKTSTEEFKNASTSVQNLTKVLTHLKSPIGIATVAITALSAAVTYFVLQETEAQKKSREFAEEIANQKQEYEDYNKSIDKTTDSNLAQINSVSKLKDELMTLVDENGKVKEGYESRVDFILHELNEALGTEYEANDGIIQKYKELQSEIDKTIEQKKAEIILKSEEQKFANARDKETEAVASLKDAQENLNSTMEKYGTDLEGLKQKAKSYYDMANNQWVTEGNPLIIDTYKKQADSIQNVIDAYENANSVVKQCTDDKKAYEKDYALFIEGKYDEIGKTVKDTTKDWTDSSLKDIQEHIIKEKETLNEYKKIYENTGSEIALQQQEQSQQNLKKLAEELANRTSTIDTLGEEEISAWKTLANSSYEEYKNAISKIGPEMKTKIQEATGVVVQETPHGAEVTEKFANAIVKELDKDSDFKKEALSSLNSYISGLSDEEKREFLKKAGIQDVDKVMEGLKEGKQLSEDQGIEILKGLNSGLKNSGQLTSLYNSASGIVSKLTNMFSIKASVSTDSLPGHKDGLDYVPYDNYVARLHKGERVLTAKENKDYMNGNINNKLATNNITLQFFPQKMTDAEMERAFQYVDKRYGIKW